MSAPVITGPWELTERHDYREIVGPCENASWYGRKGVWAVGYVDTDWSPEDQDAIGRLFAAAPDLLAALTALMREFFPTAKPDDYPEWTAARAAILRATAPEKGEG